MSNRVKVQGSIIETGDDCIAIKDGVRNLLVGHIACGPGHGISIGSLAEKENEVGVQKITVKSVVFTYTQTGIRIKTWSRHSTGIVKGLTVHNAVMRNVQNPIIIDQNYCPSGKNCPNQHSGIKIGEVTFRNIKGSSATPVAVKFDCSKKNHCTRIQLKNINLTYGIWCHEGMWSSSDWHHNHCAGWRRWTVVTDNRGYRSCKGCWSAYYYNQK